MNTQSHAIINVALLSRKDKPHLHLYALLGGVLPDVPMFIFFGIETLILKHSQGKIWSEQYFLPQWQNIFDIFNSMPFILIALGIGYYFRSERVTVFCWSMLLHCIADFFLHREDAHRHFFPFSQYTFISPISYWEPDHYGQIASVVEILAIIVASVFLYPRLQSRLSRGALVTVNVISMLVYTAIVIFS